MSKKLKYNCILAISCQLLAISCSYAQQKGIDTIEVNVITKYKPVINDAVKLNSNPAIADTAKIQRKVEYSLLNSQFPTYYTPPLINAIQLKPEPIDALYHSFLSAGGGNYNTLYAEYFFNSLRSGNEDYGIHLNHLSSQATLDNYGYSGYSFNDVNLYVKKYFGEHSLYAEANFDNHVVHDYGYNINEYQLTDNTTRESYDLLGGYLKYKSEYRDSSKINNELKIGYDNFSDIYNSMENNLDAQFKLFSCFNRLRFDLDGMAEYYNDKSSIYNMNNSDFLLNPFFTTNERRWDAHIGADAYYSPALGNVNFYPDILLRFHVAQDIVMIYGGVDGKQTFNSYKSLSDQNPFVQDTLNMKFTLVQYHVFGGLAGNITSQLTYNASVAQSQVKNMPLFVTDLSEPLQNRFAVIYDNVKELNIHGDLDYKMESDFSMTLEGDYFCYTPTTQLEVWYHPALKISLEGRYTIQEKYIIRAEFFVLGSQYAPQFIDGVMTAKTLSGEPDLNLGFDYKFSKAFSAFLNLNNLANVTYYQWDNYPLQRFNVMVGVRLGF
jgi:hypothetical protein